MVPREVIFLEELPLNTSKKPDLKALEEMYNNMKLGLQETKKQSKMILIRISLKEISYYLFSIIICYIYKKIQI